MKQLLALCILCNCLIACSQKESVDLLVYNATIYTVDSAFSTTEAMVIKDGKIVATGTSDALNKTFDPKDKLDAGGKFIYPGFIDAHAHFVGYGSSLQRVNLVGTESWREVGARTRQFATDNNITDGQWIIGRGWDQNDWENKVFPSKELLDSLFPNNPVLLTRIDGHAAIANEKALTLAGVKPGDKLTGGEVEVINGRLTGILIDNAVDIVSNKIPASTDEQFAKALKAAEKNCFAMGLTTIDDCGLSYISVDRIRALQNSGELKMRLYVMLSDEAANYDYLEKNGNNDSVFLLHEFFGMFFVEFRFILESFCGR